MATRSKLDRLHEQIDRLIDRLDLRLEPPPQSFELICDASWSEEQIEAGLCEKYPDYTGDPRDKVILFIITHPPGTSRDHH